MKAFDWKQILGQMIFRKKLTGPMGATAEKSIVMRKNTFKNRTGFLITIENLLQVLFVSLYNLLIIINADRLNVFASTQISELIGQ